MGIFRRTSEECYAEAQRRIKLCAENGEKTLYFSDLCYLNVIPPEIVSLQNLNSLTIGNEYLAVIPDFIGKLVSLKKLDLEWSVNDYDKEMVLPESLKNLKNLQTLSVRGQFQEIPSWIGELKKLTSLIITCNSVKTIPPEIGKLNKLHTLEINGSEITELPGEIAECPISSMSLHCGSIASFPESFKQLSQLKQFTTSDLRNLSKSDINIIGEWESLTSLTFGDSEISRLPEKIGDLRNLVKLMIHESNIKQLPESLSDCPLEALDLNVDFEYLPQSFGNLSKLKTLTLYGSELKSLPDSFGSLCSLENLVISTVQNLKMPESFGNLHSLQKLRLDIINTETLPESFGRCKNLKSLDIISDTLTKLPESFIELENLKEIHLDTFNLKELPSSFDKFGFLEEIDISSGVLTMLPESIGNLKNLKKITINASNVQELPTSFKNLSYVEKKEININSRVDIKYENLGVMDDEDRKKALQRCSSRELDALLLSAPEFYFVMDGSEKDNEIVEDIIRARRKIMMGQFEPTLQNILRIVEVSDKFLKAWEEGFTRGKTILDLLYEKEQDKPFFTNKYFLEIKLYPDIYYKGCETGERRGLTDGDHDDFYTVMIHIFQKIFSLSVNYDPATKDERDFRDNLHISRKSNWADCPDMPDYFKGHYLCYAVHELYDRNGWAFQDIAKINNIKIAIQVNFEGELGIF